MVLFGVLKRRSASGFVPLEGIDMMARFISKSKTLLRHSQSPKVLIVCHRHRSSEAMKAKWGEMEGVKLLEDHAHRVMIMKATPDWLPFLPGYSFWVPPPTSPFFHKFSIPAQPFLMQGSLFSTHSLFISTNPITLYSFNARGSFWECYY